METKPNHCLDRCSIVGKGSDCVGQITSVTDSDHPYTLQFKLFLVFLMSKVNAKSLHRVELQVTCQRCTRHSNRNAQGCNVGGRWIVSNSIERLSMSTSPRTMLTQAFHFISSSLFRSCVSSVRRATIFNYVLFRYVPALS
jgi:hypothetical protein